MSLSNAAENALAQWFFNNVSMPAIGADWFVALHTADPGEDGTQATNEVNYTGYARLALPRTTAAATVSGGTTTFTQHMLFPTMTGGTQGNATYVSIGYSQNGAGMILVRGALTNSIPLVTGAAPLIPSGSTVSFD